MLPVHECGHQLRTCQARRGTLEKIALVLIIEVLVEPRRPPTGETLLHEALHAKLLQVSDTFIAFLVDLQIHLPLHLLLMRSDRIGSITRLLELLAQRLYHLLQLGLFRLVSGDRLVKLGRILRCHGQPHERLPVALPVHEGGDHLRTCQA